MGFARKSSGEQAGSLLSVISFSDLNVGSGINRIPKSNALPMYLNLREVVEIRTVIFGNCCRNSDNRGISQRRAKLVGTLIRTIPDRRYVPSGCRSFFVAAKRLENTELTSLANSAPSSVRSIPRDRRQNRGSPIQSSSSLTCFPIAQCVTWSSAAALAKLPNLAAASKARIALSGGSASKI
jgi:hypothetical protein